jgi:hypothetical protein
MPAAFGMPGTSRLRECERLRACGRFQSALAGLRDEVALEGKIVFEVHRVTGRDRVVGNRGVFDRGVSAARLPDEFLRGRVRGDQCVGEIHRRPELRAAGVGQVDEPAASITLDCGPARVEVGAADDPDHGARGRGRRVVRDETAWAAEWARCGIGGNAIGNAVDR